MHATGDVNSTDDLDDVNSTDSLDDVNSTDANGGDCSADDLDDAIIEEGDEQTRQITGGPRGSVLTIENLEADPQLLSVPPSEG